jgi:hypothetical protein
MTAMTRQRSGSAVPALRLAKITASYSSISISVAFGKEAADPIQHELVVVGFSYRRLFLAKIASFARRSGDRPRRNNPDSGLAFPHPRREGEPLFAERPNIGEHDVDDL